MTGLDYQAADLWLNASGLVLSGMNSICLVVLWFGSRNRATSEAIDRVETLAKSLHADQEARIIRLEEAKSQAVTNKELTKELTEATSHIEALAKTLHADQEARLLKLEESLRHTVGVKEIGQELAPIYELVRKNEANTAAIQAELRKISEQQRDFTNLILQRGLNQ